MAMRIRHDPPTYLQYTVLAFVRADPHVALQRQRETETNRVPVQRRDDGLSDFPRFWADRGCTEVRNLLAGKRLCTRGHVGTDTKCHTGTGEDRDANVVVLIASTIGIAKLLAHFPAERIHLFGTMQRNDRDALV